MRRPRPRFGSAPVAVADPPMLRSRKCKPQGRSFRASLRPRVVGWDPQNRRPCHPRVRDVGRALLRTLASPAVSAPILAFPRAHLSASAAIAMAAEGIAPSYAASASNSRAVGSPLGSPAGAHGSGEARTPRGSSIVRTTAGEGRVEITRIFRAHRGPIRPANPKVRFLLTAPLRRLDQANNAPSSRRPHGATVIFEAEGCLSGPPALLEVVR